jgi:putative membrane protein insertion efficiency factor
MYQKHISPRLGPRCRFYPTCSAYAYNAIERFGVFWGGFLAFWRLLRCNPLFKGGYDPVPESCFFGLIKAKYKKDGKD